MSERLDRLLEALRQGAQISDSDMMYIQHVLIVASCVPELKSDIERDDDFFPVIDGTMRQFKAKEKVMVFHPNYCENGDGMWIVGYVIKYDDKKGYWTSSAGDTYIMDPDDPHTLNSWRKPEHVRVIRKVWQRRPEDARQRVKKPL